MHPPFTADDLALVLAIREAGTLAGAAIRLDVDGSTVFRRLGALESRLGLKLFERSRAGYRPTQTGQDMAELAARIDSDIADLSLRLAGQTPIASGEVRLTTNDTLLVHLLTPILASFRAAQPTIRLDVVLSNEALNLSRRDADIALRVTAEPPETLVGRRVATMGWALYGRTSAIPRSLDDTDWVTLGDELAGTAPARYVRQRARAERIAYRVNTVLGLADAVEAGLGIGPLPCFVADRRPGLTRMSEPEPDLEGPLWILTHPELRAAPRVRLLVDHLAAAIRRQRTALAG